MPIRAPKVVLVGRPNVGKSTLFNRIVGSRRAIVAPVAGTTRDVIQQPAIWQGVTFTLTDTGGMFGASDDPLRELVLEHGRQALRIADLIVFVADGRDGVLAGDQIIAQTVRTVGCPVLLAVNKTDDRRASAVSGEFHSLGFQPIFEISAEHGTGVAELLDEIVNQLRGRRPKSDEARSTDRIDTGIAIVGRPNVGKSSLVNRLLREERMLVSDMPGTTRDAVDAVLQWHRRSFRIVDTAGMRRRGRVAKGGKIEAVSVLAASRAIEQADVVVLVIDAVEGATDQDGAIAGEVERAGRGLIIAANKWDLLKGQPAEAARFDDQLRFHLKFLDHVPIVHLSALTGERTPKLLELIDKVAGARRLRVKTPELNRFIAEVTAKNPPVSPGSKYVRILYAAQTSVAPPTFVLFTNVATTFHFSYQRYLVNQLRERFGFVGTPIRLQVRRRSRKP
ncbi:MAG: ribosome biogenesis GTPase Der, partial [Vicinamibacterales bacterium]